jgi:hypothetical protein
VPSKPKRAPRRKRAQEKTPPTAPTTIVVRRGALRRFDSMRKKVAGLPVNLVWDRRVNGERRSESAPVEGDRRKTDRRQAPPFTWTLADFVVVVPPDSEPPRIDPVEKKSRKKK